MITIEPITAANVQLFKEVRLRALADTPSAPTPRQVGRAAVKPRGRPRRPAHSGARRPCGITARLCVSEGNGERPDHFADEVLSVVE